MNSVTITGNLVADPIIRAKDDKKNATFTVAVRGGRDHTDFIRCIAFGQRAEYLEKFAKKGARIAVAGSLHTDSYTNKDGKKVNTVDVYANEVELPRLTPASDVTTPSEPSDDGFVNIEEDDMELPFN